LDEEYRPLLSSLCNIIIIIIIIKQNKLIITYPKIALERINYILPETMAGSWDSSVSVVIRLRAGREGSHGSIPTGARNFSRPSLRSVQPSLQWEQGKGTAA
jgi:hypothetical protein